jgi:hypothetical protein
MRDSRRQESSIVIPLLFFGPNLQKSAYGEDLICPVLAGSDKSLNGRFSFVDCRKGLHTSRPGSRWPVWSGDRSQPRNSVSRRTFFKPILRRSPRAPGTNPWLRRKRSLQCLCETGRSSHESRQAETFTQRFLGYGAQGFGLARGANAIDKALPCSCPVHQIFDAPMFCSAVSQVHINQPLKP